MVTHQLQVKHRPGKGRRSKIDVLPLSYTDQCISVGPVDPQKYKIMECRGKGHDRVASQDGDQVLNTDPVYYVKYAFITVCDCIII